jgi:hypothetical protein
MIYMKNPCTHHTAVQQAVHSTAFLLAVDVRSTLVRGAGIVGEFILLWIPRIRTVDNEPLVLVKSIGCERVKVLICRTMEEIALVLVLNRLHA